MAPTLHLVRHAQGFHNLSVENEHIRDPLLTDLGKLQCAELSKIFPYHDKITHLVASPLRRTIYTTLYGFGPVVATGKQIIALPELEEVSQNPCDTGSELDVLAPEFAEIADLSLCFPGWTSKAPGTRFAPEIPTLEARGRAARSWLRSLARKAGDDAHIVVTSHGAFLHFLTEDWDQVPAGHGTAWYNAEYRSFQFLDLDASDEAASIRETDESWARRRGDAPRLTEEEQLQKKNTVYKFLKFWFEDAAKANPVQSAP